MDLTHEIKEIALYYGLEAQSRQTMEECAELIQALNKYLRNVTGGQPAQEHNRDKLISDVAEEIADVSIMLEQMKFLFNCNDEVSQVIQKKIERTYERDEGLSNRHNSLTK